MIGRSPGSSWTPALSHASPWLDDSGGAVPMPLWCPTEVLNQFQNSHDRILAQKVFEPKTYVFSFFFFLSQFGFLTPNLLF